MLKILPQGDRTAPSCLPVTIMLLKTGVCLLTSHILKKMEIVTTLEGGN